MTTELNIRGIIVILTVLVSGSSKIYGQPGFFIPKSANVNFTGDSSSIFCDVYNRGNLVVARSSTIVFSGEDWNNETTTAVGSLSVTPINEAGTITFSCPYAPQRINGGYNAASKTGFQFWNIEIDNPNGVHLAGSNTKVRNEVKLTRGHLYLNDNILAVGNNFPGEITGYDTSKFIVTGNMAGKGLLLREGIDQNAGEVVFPVGTAPGKYTPASIRYNTTTADEFYVGVSDSVRVDALNGDAVVSNSVNKTWQVGQRYHPGSGEVEVSLQHDSTEEGAYFAQYRDAAYVSQFVSDKWDIDTLYNPSVARTTAQQNTTTRTFQHGLQSTTFLTKLIAAPDPTAGFSLWVSAYRESAGKVYVNWQVSPEEKLHSYTIQRRYANEQDFSDVAVVLVQPPFKHYYKSPDNNSYAGVTYYRIKIIHNDRSVTYSKTIPVSGVVGKVVNVVWPNPSKGVVHIGMNYPDVVDKIVLFNVSGQILLQEKVNGRPVLQVNGLNTGTYFLSFIDKRGSKIETKQIIVER